jgi:hypothetical protein
MPHPSTVTKVANFLKYMCHRLKTEQRIAICEELRAASLGSDYAIAMTQEGIIKKLYSGTRGVTYYEWSKEHTPDTQTALKLVMAYNRLKREQKRIRDGEKPRKTNEQHLVEIKEVVKQILTTVQKIK